MEHLWSILAREVIVAQDTGNVSLINVVERIGFTTDPKKKRPKGPIGVPVQFTLITTWKRSNWDKPESGRARVLVADPTGKNLRSQMSPEYNVDLNSSVYFRVTLFFPAFPFTISGMYSITTQMREGRKWRSVGSVPLQLIDTIANPD